MTTEKSRVVWRKSSRTGAGNGTGDNCVEIGALPTAWRKSSRSGGGNSGNGDCIEIGASPTTVGVRDSKAPTLGQLWLSPTDWAAFVATVRTNG